MSGTILARIKSIQRDCDLTSTQSKVNSMVAIGARQFTDPYFIASSLIGVGAFAGVVGLSSKVTRVWALGMKEGLLSSALKIYSPFVGAITYEMAYRTLITLNGKGSQYPGLWDLGGKNGIGHGIGRAICTFSTSLLFALYGFRGGYFAYGGYSALRPQVNHGLALSSGFVGGIMVFGVAFKGFNGLYDFVVGGATEKPK